MCPVAKLLQTQNEEYVLNGITLLAKACVRMDDGRVVRPSNLVRDASSVEIQINVQASSLRIKHIV
jgi:hypothetical protein